MNWIELYRIYEEAKKNISSLGYTIGPITEFRTNSRYKQRQVWSEHFRTNLCARDDAR